MYKEQAKHPFFVVIALLIAPNPLFLVGERGNFVPVVWGPYDGQRFLFAVYGNFVPIVWVLSPPIV